MLKNVKMLIFILSSKSAKNFERPKRCNVRIIGSARLGDGKPLTCSMNNCACVYTNEQLVKTRKLVAQCEMTCT